MNQNGYDFPVSIPTNNMKAAGIYAILKSVNPNTGWNNSLFDAWLQVNGILGWQRNTSQSDPTMLKGYTYFPSEWKIPQDYVLQYSQWMQSGAMPQITIFDNNEKQPNYLLYAGIAAAVLFIFMRKR